MDVLNSKKKEEICINLTLYLVNLELCMIHSNQCQVTEVIKLLHVAKATSETDARTQRHIIICHHLLN